jgi:hypothetical protein
MLQFLSRFASKQQQPDPETIIADTKLSSYGQEVSGMNDETIQAGIEWVFISLLAAGYKGQAHLFWLDAEKDAGILKLQRRLIYKDELVFLYRCSDRTPPAPNGFYWRLMPEHPEMRIYQLELRTND